MVDCPDTSFGTSAPFTFSLPHHISLPTAHNKFQLPIFFFFFTAVSFRPTRSLHEAFFTAHMQRSHRRPSDRRKLVLPSPPAVCVPFHRCTNFGTKGATPGGSCPLPGVRYSERFDFLLPSFSYLFTLFREALRINQSHKPKAEIVAIQVEYFFFICSFLSGQVTAETDERFAALAPFGSETSFGFTPQNSPKYFEANLVSRCKHSFLSRYPKTRTS